MAAAVLFLWGCGAPQVQQAFLRETVDLSYVRTIAVLPFEGANSEPVREIAITEVLALGIFDVLDKGRVDSALRDEAVQRGTPLDPQTLRRLGQRLKVQAFLLGSVLQESAGTGASAAYPVITLTLRLVDSESNVLLWQASGRESGYSLMDRLFGLGASSSFEITLGLLERLLVTLGSPQR